MFRDNLTYVMLSVKLYYV